MDRIEFLRNRTFREERFSWEFHYLFYRAYHALRNLPEPERYAESYYTAFSQLRPALVPGELIAGNRDLPMEPQAQEAWETTYRAIAQDRADRAGWGQDSHMAVDYELLLSEGITGVIAKIDRYLSRSSEEASSFYRVCRRCLEGILVYADHYADTAEKISQTEEDPVYREEMKTLAAICRRVPAQPADSFHEAVQSVHFLTHCLSLNPFRMCFQQFQLGRPDQYLLPFYQKDLQNGSITPEFAQLLLDCLAIQINMRVPNGLSSGYMVGGRDREGNIVANDLTIMAMQVIENVHLVYPSVGFCYSEGMPEDYLEKACSILLNGHSHPAIFNDDVISQGLIRYGIPPEDAHNYIHSTCVEITPVAASNVWVASPYTNMPQLLLNAMDREYPDLQSLIQRIWDDLDRSIQVNLDEQLEVRAIRRDNSRNPLLSCFVSDCLDRGVDIEQGGARYNWIMPSFVGMANLVDSLCSVKKLVFEEKKLTIRQFKEILDQNFLGQEALQQYILNKIPKYGNDMDEVDSLFSAFTEHIVEECQKHTTMFSNGRLIPSVFCWIMHEYFGRQTSATPDGRPAGFPLGDGSGPCQGRELKGPTASILSSTKWDHTPFIGGVAVNLKFSRAALGEHSLSGVKSLVQTYLHRKGFEVQINVIDNQTLRKAQKNPELYRDLVVRIGGYSDYFVKLSSQMQDELIQRTTHSI